MPLLNILKYPDARLRTKAKTVTEFGAKLKTLSENMAETMYANKGIGLAATQVDEHIRFLIIDLGDLDENEKYVEGDEEAEVRLADKRTVQKLEVFVNPKILKSSGEIGYEEGCLSVPGVYANVTRKENLTLQYQDLDGNTHKIETSGLKSIVLQHEMDHLEGIVFPDRIGHMQRMLVLDKYNKLQALKEATAVKK